MKSTCDNTFETDLGVTSMLGLRFGNVRANVGLLLVTSVLAMCVGQSAFAGILPLPPEQRIWSDMYFGGISGSYNSGTKILSMSDANQATNMEIGGQYGPGNEGTHYGPPTEALGTGPVVVTLSVTNVEVQSDGSVSNGGLVRITYNGPADNNAGNMADDYGLVAGSVLLEGSVLEVMLDPPGIGFNKLDVLWSITSGALQNINPALGVNFAPGDYGLLRIAGPATLPSDWSASFTLNGSDLDVYGVPEPSSITLGLLGAILAFLSSSRRYFAGRRVG